MNSDPLQRIEGQLLHQSNKMEALTDSISLLAQTLARKEERDHHIDESIKEIKLRVNKVEDSVSTLKDISSGDAAMRKIFWIGLTVSSTALISAIVYSVITK